MVGARAFTLSRAIPVVSPSASVTNQGYGSGIAATLGRAHLLPRLMGEAGGNLWVSIRLQTLISLRRHIRRWGVGSEDHPEKPGPGIVVFRAAYYGGVDMNKTLIDKQ